MCIRDSSTTVLAANGEETATLVGQGANRQYVTIDEIPLDLQHAFVAIEDERLDVYKRQLLNSPLIPYISYI